MIAAILDAGGSPLYTETLGGHSIWSPIYNDPTKELYSWMFEGVAPPLATLLYNPENGSVKIDANLAPGGVISTFNLVFELGVFTPPATVAVNGTVVEASSFFHTVDDKQLIFADGVGLSGELDLGTILPTGLDFLSLYDIMNTQFYQTGATGRTRRFLNVVIAVPEPSSALLFIGGMAIVALHRN